MAGTNVVDDIQSAHDFDWGSDGWKVGALGGAAFLPMIFGGDSKADKGVSQALADLQKSSANLTQKGNSLTNQGQDVMGPALKYMQAVTGGDPAAIAEATKPERRRIIDQYDTAKQNVSEFAPRGGGTAGALATLNAQQASDLSTTGAQARQSALGPATQTGTALQQLGAASEGQVSQNMTTVLNTYMKQAEDSGKSAGEIGKNIASILGMVLSFV